MIEECGHDQRPTMAEDTHPPPASALPAGRTGHGGECHGRESRFGFVADGEQPLGGEGDGQPESFCPGRIGHPGMLPLPPTPFDFFEALLDPGA